MNRKHSQSDSLYKNKTFKRAAHIHIWRNIKDEMKRGRRITKYANE